MFFLTFNKTYFLLKLFYMIFLVQNHFHLKHVNTHGNMVSSLWTYIFKHIELLEKKWNHAHYIYIYHATYKIIYVLARSISLYLLPVVHLLVTPFEHTSKLFCIMLMLAHILRFIELNQNSSGHIKIKYTYILKGKWYFF